MYFLKCVRYYNLKLTSLCDDYVYLKVLTSAKTTKI